MSAFWQQNMCHLAVLNNLVLVAKDLTVAWMTTLKSNTFAWEILAVSDNSDPIFLYYFCKIH